MKNTRIEPLLWRRPLHSAIPHGPTPRVLWIELTSKCPFDCVFCSRRLRHGNGVHMEMRLFERIIGELEDPEIIRLNYSGESTHHPGIIKAIRLASATGATVEIVTALSSLPDQMVERIPDSGLDRLTLSLHTLDPDQYHEIYGFGSVDVLRRKVDALLSARERAGQATPMLDIAFVAMDRNLAQLHQVAAYASQVGATGISIHPVIRRDPITETFESELEDGVLRPDFLDRLSQAVDRVRGAHPNLPVAVSTPEICDATPVSHQPTPFPGKLPRGARIHSCEQNPWETVHILADGTVVTCEVRDGIPLGRISADYEGTSLKDSGQGPPILPFGSRSKLARRSSARHAPTRQPTSRRGRRIRSMHPWVLTPSSCSAGMRRTAQGCFGASARVCSNSRKPPVRRYFTSKVFSRERSARLRFEPTESCSAS